jgi:hypothetical protein
MERGRPQTSSTYDFFGFFRETFERARRQGNDYVLGIIYFDGFEVFINFYLSWFLQVCCNYLK